jgi:hypothetical protein
MGSMQWAGPTGSKELQNKIKREQNKKARQIRAQQKQAARIQRRHLKNLAKQGE